VETVDVSVVTMDAADLRKWVEVVEHMTRGFLPEKYLGTSRWGE
jgi:hypothetical protein